MVRRILIIKPEGARRPAKEMLVGVTVQRVTAVQVAADSVAPGLADLLDQTVEQEVRAQPIKERAIAQAAEAVETPEVLPTRTAEQAQTTICRGTASQAPRTPAAAAEEEVRMNTRKAEQAGLVE